MRRSKSNARRNPIHIAATTLAAITAVASVGALGCEDGPNQTYSPATPAETAVWNNPGGSNVSPSSKDFSYLSGGTNANVICNGPTLAAVWSAMDKQPIIPPVEAGGLDMAGPGCTPTSSTCTWPGITIEQAEQILCQSTNDGDLFGDGELANSWGDNGELIAHYLITTHKIDFLWIQPGYLGNITATGCMGVDGKPTASMGHTYQIPLGTQLLKDSMPWDIDWAAPKTSTDWRNELTSALTCQFQPTLATSADCNSTGACVQGSFGDEAYIAVSPLGFLSFYIANQYAAQPVPSIMGAIQMPLAKITPFGNAAINLKIDNVGPTAVAGVLNTQTNMPCTMQFGSTFGDFLSECVETTGNMTTDLGNYNKLIGGIQHDDERFYFNIQGVDLNFGDSRLMPTQVAGDQDIPAAADTASNFSIDQNTLGPIVHDYAGNDTTQTKDCHGNGLVMTEMMRIAQATLNQEEVAQGNAAFTHYLGDPACADTNPGGPAAGCTGLETVITTAPQALITATTTLPASIACNPGNGSLGYDKFAGTDRPGDCDTTGSLVTVPTTLTAAELAMLTNVGLPAGIDITALNAPPPLASQRLGMRPGTPNVAFCPETASSAPGYPTNLLNCPTTYQGLIVPTSVARIKAIAGNGVTATLPVDAQDSRFFFRAYVQALVKYLKAEGAATIAGTDPSAITLADVDSQFIDPYNIFFDSIGAGQFEQAEYIERAFATSTLTGSGPVLGGGPNVTLDFVFSADVIHGIMNGYNYDKYLYRGESALYLAEADSRDGVAHPIASQDNTLLTNLVGSPVLLGGWSDHTSDFGATDCAGGPCTAFYCATHNDSPHCDGQIAPMVSTPTGPQIQLDGFGNPYLAAYEGAFTGNATAFTIGGGTGMSSPVAISTVKNSGDTGTGTYENVQEIFVQVPLHANPYDLTAGPPPGQPPIVQALIPWAPQQPGIGFPVAIDGQREQFIDTSQMDFSGVQVTALADWDYELLAGGVPTTQILFLAVETTDFLGDLFVCQDTNTKDLLTATMYTSISTILQWIAAHPTSYTECNLIMEYSNYENYLDWINSQSNGVRLESTQGGGFGRIVGATLFDPNLPNNLLSQ
jgi:hypothetical protein